MTAMPEMVALFNGSGGLASLLVGWSEYLRTPDSVAFTATATVLAVLIGGVAFTGSLVAFGKLAGWISGRPLLFRGQQLVNALILAAGVLLGLLFVLDPAGSNTLFLIVIGVALVPRGAGGHSHRRGRHADRDLAPEQLLGPGGQRRRLHPQQQRADRGRFAGRRQRADLDPDHVQEHEPVAGQRPVQRFRRRHPDLLGGGRGRGQGRSAARTPTSSSRPPATSSSCPDTGWRWRRRSTRSASWRTCSRRTAPRSVTPSTRLRVACRGT